MKQQTIKAVLNKVEDGHSHLIFHMKSGNLVLDLDEENNVNQIRELFAQLLEEMFKNPITIEAEIPEERAKDLYGVVSKDYIDQLNIEIQRVQPRIENLKNK